jgi:hypothetical protein
MLCSVLKMENDADGSRHLLVEDVNCWDCALWGWRFRTKNLDALLSSSHKAMCLQAMNSLHRRAKQWCFEHCILSVAVDMKGLSSGKKDCHVLAEEHRFSLGERTSVDTHAGMLG